MGDAEGRSTLPNVVVDPEQVQESGLLKDTIIHDVPDEAGTFDTVLVRRATDKLKEPTEAWNDYAKAQGTPPVHPLMVKQVRNTPDAADLARTLDIVRQEWTDGPQTSISQDRTSGWR